MTKINPLLLTGVNFKIDFILFLVFLKAPGFLGEKQAVLLVSFYVFLFNICLGLGLCYHHCHVANQFLKLNVLKHIN